MLILIANAQIKAFAKVLSYSSRKSVLHMFLKMKAPLISEDHWLCIAHLSAEVMLKSAVNEEKKFKHSPRVGTDYPLGPKF